MREAKIFPNLKILVMVKESIRDLKYLDRILDSESITTPSEDL